MKLDYRGLAILAGLFTSFYLFLDSFILHTVLPNIYTYAIIGSWVAVLLTILYARVLGKKLDKAYKGLFKISKKSIKYAIIAGLLSAASTIIYLYVAKKYDPSLIGPLLPIVLVFMIFRDMYVEKEKPSLLEFTSIFTILIGAVLVSFNGGKFDLLLILIVVVIHNSLVLLTGHFQKKGMTPETDSMNFRLITAIGVAVAITIYSFRSVDLNFNLVHALPLVLASMSFVFLSMICYLMAVRDGKLSVVYSLNLSYVIFSTAITLIVANFLPNIFSIASGVSLVIKLIGISLIIVGVLSVVLGDTYVYLFIRTIPKENHHVFNELAKLPEVVTVYHTFGKKDIIAKVRVRLVGKMENTISSKIRPIKGILEIERLNIIKQK